MTRSYRSMKMTTKVILRHKHILHDSSYKHKRTRKNSAVKEKSDREKKKRLPTKKSDRKKEKKR